MAARQVRRPAGPAAGQPVRRFTQKAGAPLAVLRLRFEPDARCRYNLKLKYAAVRLMRAGLGRKSMARILGVPLSTVREWAMTYQARGAKALLNMGERRTFFTRETKRAAARDMVDGGMTRRAVMAKYGIGDMSALKRWCRQYRAGTL